MNFNIYKCYAKSHINKHTFFIKGDNLTISEMKIQTIPFKHVYLHSPNTD